MSATWDVAVWINARWSLVPVAVPTTSLGVLTAILSEMEKHSIGHNPWTVGLWERGMWEQNTPMRKILKDMESK
jgi:hypothetical protein